MFVFWRATGVFAGGDQERATLAKCALAALQRQLDQRWFEIVVMDISQSSNSLIFRGLIAGFTRPDVI